MNKFFSSKMGKLILKLGTLLLGFTLALLLSEILLRIFWNPPYLDPSYKRDDFFWMNRNVVLNNFGYRDEDITLQKNKTIRIYSLGDSFTYGWYIDNSQLSYPSMLEKLLNNDDRKLKREVNFEVINAAQPGFKIKDSLDRFENEGILFSPDIVTLGINLFDLMDKEFPPKEPKLKILRELKLYELIFGNIDRARISRLTETELRDTLKEDSQHLKRAKENLKQLNELVTLNGGILVLIIFPNYDASNPNKPYNYFDFHQRIKEIAPSGVEIIDLLDAFNKVQDKRELVLNPTDDHPTILAHSLAATEILRQFDFKKFIDSHKTLSNEIKSVHVSLGDQLIGLKSIISFEDQNSQWVYFDRKHNLDVQKRVLENKRDRQLAFMRDTIETTKSLTHDGWVGAKLEMYFLGSHEIIVKRNTYQYPIVGVSQLTAYKRDNGSVKSHNLNLKNLEVTRDSQNITIKVLSKEDFDFFKVIFDVAISQMDIDKGFVVSFSKTEVKKAKLKIGEQQARIMLTENKFSFPKFVASSESYGYVWFGDKLQRVNLIRIEGQLVLEFILPAGQDTEIEIPMQLKLDEETGPIVKYI